METAQANAAIVPAAATAVVVAAGTVLLILGAVLASKVCWLFELHVIMHGRLVSVYCLCVCCFFAYDVFLPLLLFASVMSPVGKLVSVEVMLLVHGSVSMGIYSQPRKPHNPVRGRLGRRVLQTSHSHSHPHPIPAERVCH